MEIRNKKTEDIWENYAPKEPLIKDEKTRKAVRAWADALGFQEVYCASNGYEIYGGIDDWVIQFDGEPFPFADKNKIYTIAELCGEESPKETRSEAKKIQKIIRAWAEVNGVKELKYIVDENSLQDIFRNSISFNRVLDLEDGEQYTIAELCGEEEE